MSSCSFETWLTMAAVTFEESKLPWIVPGYTGSYMVATSKNLLSTFYFWTPGRYGSYCSAMILAPVPANGLVRPGCIDWAIPPLLRCRILIVRGGINCLLPPAELESSMRNLLSLELGPSRSRSSASVSSWY